MSRTLSQLSEPTSPPTLAQSQSLTNNVAALADIGRADLKAIGIVCLIIVNKAAGDTDYTSAHAQLRQDAATMFKGIERLDDNGTNMNFLLIQTVLMWALAKDVDATTPTNVDTLLNTGRGFRSQPEETLNRILLFLTWMMSV